MEPTADQKVWFITGTSTGFGKRLVQITLARGDLVIATVRRIEDFQLTLSQEDSSRLRIVALDLTDTVESIEKTIAEAVAFWGRIDVLVNNAGWAPKSIIEEGHMKLSAPLFQTNVFGMLNVTNAVLPHMRERRSGTVVFFGSRSVWKADTVLTGFYIATKAAIHAIGETYAAELAPFGIRVLILAPGGFRTENIATAPLTIDKHITDYDATREREIALFRERWKDVPGDPMKAMNLLVDVVRGEGRAHGKKFPLFLPLGNPTYDAARAHCTRLLQTMDEWEDIAKDLDFDPEE
ncbi:NAD(P)-binding protein [Wolfiporia cocos MD-104 SS10]|uniref:NAD(P)-binding protein n=1 Tax=Wolfiporia cocos (strain MD-104) TaxID=742152 RepID=A0A2H3JL23_WOLCO|nr:NAD(P)-binding protein [Wolfiporia cocos MD-104 SS10]